MSSHREAPEISKDPCADSTDVYAFVSPDRPDTVTILCNYIPLEDPAGGPNFFEFGDDVLYTINIDNDGDGKANVTYEFRFTTNVPNPNSSSTTPASSTASTARRTTGRRPTSSPKCATAGAAGWPRTCSRRRATSALRSTPNYSALANAGDLRPRQRHPRVRRAAPRRLLRRPRLDLRPRRAAPVPEPPPDPDTGCARRQRGALVQRAHARRAGADHPPHPQRQGADGPDGCRRRRSACGRRRTGRRPRSATTTGTTSTSARSRRCRGSATRCSTRSSCRSARKDEWNRKGPHRDSEFAQYVARPELGRLLPFLYPGVFPNLAAYDKDRADLLAILLTGIPAGIVPGFQNFTGHDAGRPAAPQRGDPAGRRARTSTASSAATSPASRTAGACSTTSSPSSCAPWPG